MLLLTENGRTTDEAPKDSDRGKMISDEWNEGGSPVSESGRMNAERELIILARSSVERRGDGPGQ